jgi:hypothetical protein
VGPPPLTSCTYPLCWPQIKKVPRIGNSPTFISVQHFKKLAPVWYNTTMAIFKDEAAHKVRERGRGRNS